MKKACKTIGIISGIIIAIGLALTIVGAATGGVGYAVSLLKENTYGIQLDDYIDDNDISINNGDIIAINNNINNIELDGEAGDFRIENWDKNYIGVYSKNKNGYYSVDGSTLKVKGKEMSNIFFFKKNQIVKMIVYIPKNTQFQEVKLDIGAGNIETGSFGVNNLTLDIGAGNAKLQDVNATNMDLEVGAGNIDIAGSTTGNIDIECGLGNATLDLSNNYNEFNYGLEIGLGKIKLNDDSFGKDKTINNNAINQMNIDCGMGNVKVKFNQ